jgi:DNA gyrase subunit A
VLAVQDTDELMMITQNGMSVRTAVSGISVIGRATQGVRLIHVEAGDRLVACAKVAAEDITTSEPSPRVPAAPAGVAVPGAATPDETEPSDPEPEDGPDDEKES